MRIVAASDVHGDQFLDAYVLALEKLERPDLLLWAGDMTDHNHLGNYERVVNATRERYDGPIVAVFGNNEYTESYAEYRRRFPEVTFVHDEVVTVDVGGSSIRIVGSIGSLDTPTWWQRKNLPGIAEEYARRVQVVDRLLDHAGPSLLLMHYPPTYKTVVGEGEHYWDQIACRKYEDVLLRRRPKLVIHGHAHKGTPYGEVKPEQRTLADFDDVRAPVPVHNVAWPVRNAISVFEW